MPMPSLARTQNRDLERLATAFKVDTARLFDQFKEHVPIVQAELRRAPEVPAATAWQCAIQRTQATKRRRQNFPAENAARPAAALRCSSRLHSGHRAKPLHVQKAPWGVLAGEPRSRGAPIGPRVGPSCLAHPRRKAAGSSSPHLVLHAPSEHHASEGQASSAGKPQPTCGSCRCTTPQQLRHG